ncbi:MAG: phosphoribosyl-ATP diphosphatase, partial [Gemmatimonadaceae bacterium]
IDVSASDATHVVAPLAPVENVDVLDRLAGTIAAHATTTDLPNEKPSYTRRLLNDRNLRLKKIGEEGAELVVACADGDHARAAEEGADLVYHSLVALAAIGVSLDDVRNVLINRERH